MTTVDLCISSALAERRYRICSRLVNLNLTLTLTLPTRSGLLVTPCVHWRAVEKRARARGDNLLTVFQAFRHDDRTAQEVVRFDQAFVRLAFRVHDENRQLVRASGLAAAGAHQRRHRDKN